MPVQQQGCDVSRHLNYTWELAVPEQSHPEQEPGPLSQQLTHSQGLRILDSQTRTIALNPVQHLSQGWVKQSSLAPLGERTGHTKGSTTDRGRDPDVLIIFGCLNPGGLWGTCSRFCFMF